MKAKSRVKSKRDNDTPEKMSDDSRSIIDVDINNKVSESFDDLKITENMLQKYYNPTSYEDELRYNLNTFAVRYELPIERQPPKCKRICVLKKAPAHVAAVPSSSLLEQPSLRVDENSRPVQHSILGSLEDYFKMCLSKDKMTLQEVPVEFRSSLGQNINRRPFTAMLPVQRDHPPRYNTTTRKRDASHVTTDPDTRALKLWEQRMAERRNLQTHISKTVQRIPENLIFNSGEEFRRKMEENYIISKSIPFYGGGYGYRTGSEFWKQNEVIYSGPNDELHMTNTMAEKGFPPAILHVGVSNQIKIEKGVPTIKPRPNMGYSGYDTQRFDGLKQVIYELDPHSPQMEDLVISGNKFQSTGNIYQSSDDMNDLSETFNGDLKKDSFSSQGLTRPNTEESTEYTFQLPMGPCLSLNAIDLSHSPPSPVHAPVDIRVLFNDYTSNKCLEKIHFINKGSSIIRFWWKKLESYDPFQLENKDVRRFYFDTQDGILLPNQELHFPVIFKSEKSGIFSERWKLETLPILTQGRDIVICFKGVALQRDVLATTRKKIEMYLNNRVADDIVRGILDEIIKSMYFNMGNKSTEEEEFYSEKDIFQFKNDGVHYDVDSVSSLMKIHKELKLKEDNTNDDWSLSCQQLRQNIYTNESIKSVKKEEACAKFCKHMDKMMFMTIKSELVPKDLLYRIGYRTLLDFSGDMFVVLAELRKSHDIPDMELRIAREKKGSNLSRQRTNNSQSSKTSVKKQIENRTSISASKNKSKEPSNLLRESTDTLLNDIDETEKFGSRSASDIDDLTDNEPRQSTSTNPNVTKYHMKSLQMVHSLLDDAIDAIVKYWDDVSCE